MGITEIRVGNIINHLGKSCQVLGMNQTGEFKGEFYNHELVLSNGYCEASLNHCTGVDLSEEILLKVGFVNEFSNSWSDNVFQLFKNNGNVAGSEVGDFYCSTGQRYVCSFKYLHQLQNLYFALTGQELNTAGLI